MLYIILLEGGSRTELAPGSDLFPSGPSNNGIFSLDSWRAQDSLRPGWIQMMSPGPSLFFGLDSLLKVFISIVQEVWPHLIGPSRWPGECSVLIDQAEPQATPKYGRGVPDGVSSMEACGLREGKGSFPQGKTVRPDLGFLVQIYKRGPDWPVSGQVPSPSQSGGGAGVGPVSWVG